MKRIFYVFAIFGLLSTSTWASEPGVTVRDVLDAYESGLISLEAEVGEAPAALNTKGYCFSQSIYQHPICKLYKTQAVCRADSECRWSTHPCASADLTVDPICKLQKSQSLCEINDGCRWAK